MRVSSEIVPSSFRGTLKSTLTIAFLPLKLYLSMVAISLGIYLVCSDLTQPPIVLSGDILYFRKDNYFFVECVVFSFN